MKLRQRDRNDPDREPVGGDGAKTAVTNGLAAPPDLVGTHANGAMPAQGDAKAPPAKAGDMPAPPPQPAGRSGLRLGDLLVQRNLVTTAQVEEAVVLQQE